MADASLYTGPSRPRSALPGRHVMDSRQNREVHCAHAAPAFTCLWQGQNNPNLLRKNTLEAIGKGLLFLVTTSHH